MTNDKVIVRPAITSDAAAMADYVAALQAERLRTISRRPPPTEEEERTLIAKAEANDRALILVAADGDKIVGMLDIWAGAGQGDRHVARFGVSVSEDWRGHGIGRALIERAVAAAWKWPGLCRIELECVPHHHSAIRLYESIGFGVEGRKRKSMTWAAGQRTCW
jgi:RimJ/RimL family protein N-acetyltransferase